MTKLIVHAGTHKTGTTTIQRILADHRDHLRAEGLFYPDGKVPFGRTRVPHHRFAHALTGADPNGWLAAGAFVASLRNQVRKGEVVLISAEPIYRHQQGQSPQSYAVDPETFWQKRRLYLEALRRILDGFDVEILLFFRRRDAFAESLFRERTARLGWHMPFNRYLAAFRPWFDYEAQVGLFRSVFQHVRTESYDEAVSAGLVPTFFRVIGFTPPPGADTVWERRSVDGKDLFGTARARAAFLAQFPSTIPG